LVIENGTTWTLAMLPVEPADSTGTPERWRPDRGVVLGRASPVE
jgi:hypothetical protein